ncbi:MAG: SIS domain-containing protein, partial [Spirochaetales bacterium]|nr:SIS domain-containing protein [Spirochaetales bacterium]
MAGEISRYAKTVRDIITEIEKEEPVIAKAAEVIANAIANDRMVHILGTGGHSNMGVEEVLWRAGGLAAWNPILDPGTNL